MNQIKIHKYLSSLPGSSGDFVFPKDIINPRPSLQRGQRYKIGT
jgi:hypothetical protein